MSFKLENKKSKLNNVPFAITEDGSLGVLALGDLGFRAWREVKNNSELNKTINEEE